MKLLQSYQKLVSVSPIPEPLIAPGRIPKTVIPVATGFYQPQVDQAILPVVHYQSLVIATDGPFYPVAEYGMR
jgi:hypothetical protein